MPDSRLLDASGKPVSESLVATFIDSFHGVVVRPGDPRYDDTRAVFNGMIDRKPGLIVQPAGTDDVQAAVRFARQAEVLVSIKGGGHAVTGHAVCDDGLMIDLGLMKGIDVDPEARTAIAQAGVNWGEFDAATQAHGLAVTGGRVPSTGIAGLTLGSGSGWLERKLGFTVDNLLSVEIVLANGDVVRASDRQYDDLFWGLRGGGGNFGIATRFEYRLHPVGPLVFGGLLGFPRERAPELLRAYRDFMETAPDDVGGGFALLTAPPEPFIPREMQGRPVVGIIVCYTGNPADGERAIAPLLSLDPVLRLVQPMPYLALQRLIEKGNPHGLRNYWKADVYPELPDAAIDALTSASKTPLSPFTTVLLQPMGGQCARVPDDATAMGWRGAKWALHVLGMWQDAAEDVAQVGWVRNVASAASPWAQAGTYLNYLTDEGEGRVRDSFGAHYARMVSLKDRYDPSNFFRMNQNIRPSAAV